MTEQQLEEVKESYINHLKNYMSQTGALFAHITIFAEHIKKDEEDKPAVIHIPIPNEYMENDDSKDVFIEELMPELIIEIKKKFIPVGIAWASEAWMRTANKDFDLDDYKSLPKQEVVFISIETENKAETIIYETIREGIQVNSEGDLTDRIELKEMHNIDKPEGTSGRFAGLYKKLINHETN